VDVPALVDLALDLLPDDWTEVELRIPLG